MESASNLRRQLTAALGERPVIGAELAKLVMALPKQDPGVGAPILAEAYLDAIGDAPAWAVREARLRFMRGETPGLSQAFAPTPPQFAGLVRHVMAPLRQDLADLEALVSIEPETDPAEHDRVVAGLDSLRGEMKREAPATTSFKSAWDDLERRAAANGHDPKTAMDAIKDVTPKGMAPIGNATKVPA